MFGINDAGHRTVIQYINGTLYVKFSPGWYFQGFGSIEEYNDVVTFDFDKTDAEGDEATIDQKGIIVRYQDGGNGRIYGKSRYSLPGDEPTMVSLHKAFRSNVGVAQKLLKAVTEEAENLTAGLMSSEEAYATKRGIFTQWSHQQVANGKFMTELKEVKREDEATGKKVMKTVPEIKYGDDGLPMQFPSDLKEYGITVSGYQITDWDFEPKTLAQIATKREATMAIITAKANAERAKQDAITAEEQGKANVMTAKYEKEVEKQRAVVDAEMAKEVAVINATRNVDVAAQQKLEAEQKKLTAAEYKQEQILRGEGDASYKRLVLEADGALAQKLETYENVLENFAREFGKQKWVPEVQMGGSGPGGDAAGNEAANLINLLTAKTLSDLGLDMSITTGETTN
ncbi:SPFH domain-containing protein [Patescibacteria group bacterium]